MYQKLSYYPTINFTSNQIQQFQNQIFVPNLNSFCFTQPFLQNSGFYEVPLRNTNQTRENTLPFPTASQRNLNEAPSSKIQAKKSSKKLKSEQRSLQKEITSAKKNSQSNIINQFFSYYGSRIKSEKKVEKVVSFLSNISTERQKIIMVFYLAMKTLSIKRRKRYINKAILFSMFDPETLGESEELREKAKNLGVSLETLGKLLRRCTTSFLKDFCTRGILTSKRIGEFAKFQHLKRRRNIISTFLKY